MLKFAVAIQPLDRDVPPTPIERNLSEVAAKLRADALNGSVARDQLVTWVVIPDTAGAGWAWAGTDHRRHFFPEPGVSLCGQAVCVSGPFDNHLNADGSQDNCPTCGRKKANRG